MTLAGRKVISQLSPPDMKIQTNTLSIKRSGRGQNGNNQKKKKKDPLILDGPSWFKITLKKSIKLLSQLLQCLFDKK